MSETGPAMKRRSQIRVRVGYSQHPATVVLLVPEGVSTVIGVESHEHRVRIQTLIHGHNLTILGVGRSTAAHRLLVGETHKAGPRLAPVVAAGRRVLDRRGRAGLPVETGKCHGGVGPATLPASEQEKESTSDEGGSDEPNGYKSASDLAG